eukprot:2441602-Rhodomonas_salina.4
MVVLAGTVWYGAGRGSTRTKWICACGSGVDDDAGAAGAAAHAATGWVSRLLSTERPGFLASVDERKTAHVKHLKALARLTLFLDFEVPEPAREGGRERDAGGREGMLKCHCASSLSRLHPPILASMLPNLSFTPQSEPLSQCIPDPGF